jgi:hypothetical protein
LLLLEPRPHERLLKEPDEIHHPKQGQAKEAAWFLNNKCVIKI